MKKYLSIAVTVLLVACGTVSMPITRFNSEITLPHYSIVVPTDRVWLVRRPDEKAEIAIVHATLDVGLKERASSRMRFARNEVLHEIPRSWSARQVADDFRNMEKQIMIDEGVRRNRYKLGDVVMGEESVADKRYYTMKYTTSDNEVNQSATLYLYFPQEEKNRYFMVIHYSETVPHGAKMPRDADIFAPFRADFLATLKSLRIKE